jgi:hypothetical protein
MKKFASRTLIWLLLVLLIFPFQACKKDEPSDVSPGISFDLQYVNADTSLPAGTSELKRGRKSDSVLRINQRCDGV